MAMQDNYYEIGLMGNVNETIFAPKAGTQIEANYVMIKKGTIDTWEIGIEGHLRTKIGEPPLLTLTIPYHQISMIREIYGSYEDRVK